MAEAVTQEFEKPAVDQDADGAWPRSPHRSPENGWSSYRIADDDWTNGCPLKVQTPWRQAQAPYGLLYWGAGTSHRVAICVRHIVNRWRRAFQEEIWVRSVKLSCVTIFSPSYIMWFFLIWNKLLLFMLKWRTDFNYVPIWIMYRFQLCNDFN